MTFRLKEILHNDLKPLFEGKNLKYSYALHKLVNEIEDTLLTIEEQEHIDNAEAWLYCSVCDFEMSNEDFSEPYEIFDPHKFKGGSMDENQLTFFTDMLIAPEHPYSKIQEGECKHCGTIYLICPGCDAARKEQKFLPFLSAEL